MNDTYKTKIINQLIGNTPAGFFERNMFNNFQEWSDITFDEVKEIIECIKDYSLGLYAFLPFWYRYFGIDIYTYFKNNIGDTDIVKSFKDYPNKLHPATEIVILKPYNLTMETLTEVRNRLISQGAIGMDRIQFAGSGERYYYF